MIYQTGHRHLRLLGLSRACRFRMPAVSSSFLRLELTLRVDHYVVERAILASRWNHRELEALADSVQDIS